MATPLVGVLDSLAVQTAARDTFEVLVIDNASTDDTKDVVARYPWARYVYESHQDLSHARNAGMRHARQVPHGQRSDGCAGRTDCQ